MCTTIVVYYCRSHKHTFVRRGPSTPCTIGIVDPNSRYSRDSSLHKKSCALVDSFAAVLGSRFLVRWFEQNLHISLVRIQTFNKCHDLPFRLEFFNFIHHDVHLHLGYRHWVLIQVLKMYLVVPTRRPLKDTTTNIRNLPVLACVSPLMFIVVPLSEQGLHHLLR